MLSAIRSTAGRSVVRASGALPSSAAPRVAQAASLTWNGSSSSVASSRSIASISTNRYSAAPGAARSAIRSFHASASACGAGESDAELSGKLAEEIAYEKETAAASASEGEPAFLADFRKDGIWKIEDQAGSDEIALTRDFGNEHIRVLFSIGDIDTTEQDMEDDVEEDEDVPVKDDEESDSPSFPVRCAITISKSNSGAMTIDAQAIDGTFSIENISFYKDAKLATDLTAEADWARRGLYIGPQFETLDENVQTQFESFLEERGIGTDLALFIPTFAEFKEQREYCSWLENVKAFIDA